MTDPAVAYQPGQGYGTYDRGVAQSVFLKNQNGSLNLGVVWPGTLKISGVIYVPNNQLSLLGVTVFPGKYPALLKPNANTPILPLT